MENKKNAGPQWTIEVRGDARTNSLWNSDDAGPLFEQVGNKLVTIELIEDLLDHVAGKTVSSPLVIGIPELIDDEFLGHHVESQHAVVVDCLVKLFATNRIAIRP